MIAISATFTAEPVRAPLASWLRELGYRDDIAFAPYGQVMQSLVAPTSILSRAAGAVNVLLLRLEDWTREAPERLPDLGIELCGAVETFASQSSSPSLLCFCPSAPDASQTIRDLTAQVEAQIHARVSHAPGIYLLTSREMTEAYPVVDYFDAVANRTAHIPYSRDFFAGLGTLLARRIDGLRRRPSKVVVLDCDNTLWKGVCGELGPRGIEVDEGHLALQRAMLQLREQGMVLALCSKNQPQDVWDVFEQNRGMILRREHITAAEINWHAKSENLSRLAQKLGLGVDSFVFLDDNPVEIAEVQANCPSTIAVQVPASDAIASFLKHVWPLDRLKVTEEDRNRAQSYHAEGRRSESRAQSTSMRQFLSDLELQIQFQPVSEENLERMSQLTQRTNQFNVSLARRTASELRRTLNDPSCFAVAVEISDKFGNYGLVGFMLCRQESACLRVDSFMLSCRALGRGVEHHMLRQLGRSARQSGLKEVIVPFVVGERNEPAYEFLESIGRSHGSPRDNGTDYRFPVGLLCDLDPMSIADSKTRDSSTTALKPSVGATGPAGAPQIYNRIAKEFQSVEQILNRISSESVPRPELSEPYVAPEDDIESQLVEICQDVLLIDRVGTHDSLKDLGGTSLEMVQIHSRIVRTLEADISITDLYSQPTVRAIADWIRGKTRPSFRVRGVARESKPYADGGGIAVIGMAGRFPGADDVEQFWHNLVNGVNCIVEIPDNELNLAPESPLRRDPNLVRKTAYVKDADKFDTRFFGILPKEAQIMDPQHRLMLECGWHALEDAGYCPDAVDVPVGVFAGCYMNTYILASQAQNPELLASLANSFHGGNLLTELSSEKDYLATRIAFLLNLRGPSMTIQTACSTSLVAVIQACQAIEMGQCEMALAGGSTLRLPQKRGYLYTDGGIVSPDGVCRPFDADARGTVFGEGAGVVLLKRAQDAIADGDDIYAVIKGWGINNDGRSKMGFTAPSVEGQAEAIEMAHRRANLSADTITYVEAHGTGTSLGDPIEVDALTKAFRRSTDKKQFCGIGSVKSSIGHLDAAAGVVGLIKNCLAIRHGIIPPSLNYVRPNPNIDFENSPFYVVTEPLPWESNGAPRRAGLSSLGVGGTNAHVVIEQAPIAQPSIEQAPPLQSPEIDQAPQLLQLSARSQTALDQLTSTLANQLEKHPEQNLADVAHTLRVGRKTFDYSRVLVARNHAEARERLSNPGHASVFTSHQVRRNVPVSFMFPGQGSQHLNMGRCLYENDAIYQQHFDECCELLHPHLGFDLRSKIFVPESEQAASEINQTSVAQPAIFSVSYSLAKRLQQLEIVPQFMIGHSVGEFVAACLADVFSLPDALKLIAFRAQSMQQLPPGSMMAVRMTESELATAIDRSDVEIAAINGPSLCVVAGPTQSVEELQKRLEADDIVCRLLHTSHAFHSAMMEPVVEPFAELVKTMVLAAPRRPLISSVTGESLSDEQALDPMYWAQHLRRTVRFTDAVKYLLLHTESSLLEVGSGQTLSILARQHPECPKDRVVLSLSPHAKLANTSLEHFLLTLGRLWQSGTTINWALLDPGQRRHRVHLPTYPFERQRHWFAETKTETLGTSQANVDSTDSCNTNDSHDRLVGRADHAGPAVPLQTQSTPIVANDEVQVLVQQQLRIMLQQLDVWRKHQAI